ncbi:acyltransferase domain-containing protein, partial [Nocardia carnea]|uniref:acyltransferase domain-containing protein n=1 Tax=Nocardia carnea TaxID=37328 RepID=UPI0024571830
MRSTTISDYQLPDGTVPVLLSAPTPDLLAAEAADLLTYLDARPHIPVGRIAEMIFRTRVARRFRALAMVADTAELTHALRAVAAGTSHSAVIRSTEPGRGIAFVFPGQGGQRPGMGRLFYDHLPAYRAEADRCDNAFREFFAESPLEYLLDATHPADNRARIVQPALFTQMAGLAAAWRAVGVTPAATIGHSQGEIAAAYVAGRMSLFDAILIVGTRARAVDSISSDDHAMAVVAADRETCERLLARLSGWAQVSAVNSPTMTALSGERPAIAEVVDTCTQQGVFARMIPVRYPAHTGMVNDLRDVIRDAARDRLENQYFTAGTAVCFGGTLGEELPAGTALADYWFWNLRNPVRFDKAVTAASAAGIGTFVEIADHPALRLAIEENLAADSGPGARVVSTSQRAATDLSEFTRNLAALLVDEPDYRWQSLRVTDTPPALPLPDFPHARMNEVRLWLPYNTDSWDNQPVATVSADPAPDAHPAQLVVERWVRLSRRSLSQPKRLGLVDHTGGRAELVAALVAEAADQGATTRIIDPAAGADTTDIDTLVVLLPPYPELTAAAAAAAAAEFFGARGGGGGGGGGLAPRGARTPRRGGGRGG